MLHIDIFLRMSILDLSIIPIDLSEKTANNIINGENIITIHRKNILKKLIITSAIIAIE